MCSQLKNAEKEPNAIVDTEPETEILPPDGGWGWVVCFAAFMTDFIISGMTSSNGIILLGLLDFYGESVSKTSLVGSVFSGTTMFGGPLVLILIVGKASHRQIMIFGGIIATASTIASAFVPRVEIMIFTYGIMTGLSLAMNFFAANVILGSYFDKKRAVALGIANSGSGCGSFALSYLCERGISFYELKGAFLLIGGLFLNLVVFGSLCRPLKPVIKRSQDIPDSRRTSGDKDVGEINIGFTQEDERSETQSQISAVSGQYSIEKIEEIPETIQLRRLSVYSEQLPTDFGNVRTLFCDTTIFRNKTFIILLVVYFTWAVGDSFFIYLPAYAESVGQTREEGALLLSIYGIISTMSQILVGVLADVLHIPSSYLLFSSLFGMSVCMISLPFCHTFATLAASTVIFSISYSFGISLRLVVVASIIGVEKMSAAYSFLSMLIGVGYTIYPIISGNIYDATLSFSIIFFVDFGITLVGTILSCVIIHAQKKGKFDK